LLHASTCATAAPTFNGNCGNTRRTSPGG
jgi:hypothetical protein